MGQVVQEEEAQVRCIVGVEGGIIRVVVSGAKLVVSKICGKKYSDGIAVYRGAKFGSMKIFVEGAS